jgi:hypothetical protein
MSAVMSVHFLTLNLGSLYVSVLHNYSVFSGYKPIYENLYCKLVLCDLHFYT